MGAVVHLSMLWGQIDCFIKTEAWGPEAPQPFEQACCEKHQGFSFFSLFLSLYLLLSSLDFLGFCFLWLLGKWWKVKGKYIILEVPFFWMKSGFYGFGGKCLCFHSWEVFMVCPCWFPRNQMGCKCKWVGFWFGYVISTVFFSWIFFIFIKQWFYFLIPCFLSLYNDFPLKRVIEAIMEISRMKRKTKFQALLWDLSLIVMMKHRLSDQA